MTDDTIGGAQSSSASHCAAKSGGAASPASGGTGGPQPARKRRTLFLVRRVARGRRVGDPQIELERAVAAGPHLGRPRLDRLRRHQQRAAAPEPAGIGHRDRRATAGRRRPSARAGSASATRNERRMPRPGVGSTVFHTTLRLARMMTAASPSAPAASTDGRPVAAAPVRDRAAQHWADRLAQAEPDRDHREPALLPLGAELARHRKAQRGQPHERAAQQRRREQQSRQYWAIRRPAARPPPRARRRRVGPPRAEAGSDPVPQQQRRECRQPDDQPDQRLDARPEADARTIATRNVAVTT